MLNQNSNDVLKIKKTMDVQALVGVVLILVSVLVYTFVTRSVSDAVTLTQTEVATKTTTVNTLQSQIDEFKKAEEEFNLSSTVNKEKSLLAVPTKMYQDQIIKDVVGIAASYDITLRSLSFGKGFSNKQSVSSLQINAGFEGNYNDLVTFLKGIEQNPRKIRVNSISVQVGVMDLSLAKRASFTLAMEAFYQK